MSRSHVTRFHQILTISNHSEAQWLGCNPDTISKHNKQLLRGMSLPGVIRSWPPLPTITQIPRRLLIVPPWSWRGVSTVHWPLSAPEAASPRLLLTSHRAHCALEAGHWSPGGQGTGETSQIRRQADRLTHHTSP